MRFEEPEPPEAAVASTEDCLVEHVEWLRRVARALVADADDGEDAVQDTCLTTLLRPPWPGPTVRAWLKRVLLRRLVRERVGRGRREARESAAGRPEAVPSAHEISERMDVEHLITRAVAKLPEVQRVAIWMRYWENEPPRAIAERLGVPVETVRTRLKRALASLRSTLERTRGSDWKAALLPIAGLPIGAGSPVLAAGGLAGIALGTGAIALKTKLWIATGVVLVGALLGTLILAPTWLGLPEERTPAATENSLTTDSAYPREGENRITAAATERQSSPDAASPTTIPANALRFRVLDAEGRPVNDVEVGVRPRTSDGPPSQPIWKANSDNEGRAIWADAAKSLAESEAELEAAVIEFVGVLPGLPLSKDRDAGEEVVLRLPPTGSVHLRVVDPEARPCTNGYATLQYALDPTATSIPPNVSGFHGVVISEGQATFRFVALGIPLRAKAHPVPIIDGSIDLEPLRDAGEIREAELRFDRGLRVLKVRLMRMDGVPLSRAYTTVELRFAHGGESTGGTSGPQGEFYLRVTGDPEKEQEAHLQVHALDYGTGEMTTRFQLTEGMFDAGELVLKEDPIALTGTVLRDGKGAERLCVLFRFLGADEKLLKIPPPLNTWSEAEGRFSYRMSAEAIKKVAYVEARVDHASLQTSWTRFAPGTRDVVLSTTPGGRIEIRPLPVELVRHAHRFRLSSRGYASDHLIHGWAQGEKIVFEGLVAGSYSLRVHTSEHPEIATEIDGLEVRSGETCTDPRLDPLDLGSRVTCFLFDLVPPEGRDINGGDVSWRRSGNAEAAWIRDQFYRELGLLVSPPGPIDIMIRVPRMRPVHFEGLERGCEVRLKAGIPLSFGLEANTALPPNCRVVWAQLERVEDAIGSGKRGADVRFDDLFNQRCEIGEPGRYRVRWRLEIHEKSEASTQTDFRVADPPQVIEILDVPGEQRFVLALPPK